MNGAADEDMLEEPEDGEEAGMREGNWDAGVAWLADGLELQSYLFTDPESGATMQTIAMMQNAGGDAGAFVVPVGWPSIGSPPLTLVTTDPTSGANSRKGAKVKLVELPSAAWSGLFECPANIVAEADRGSVHMLHPEGLLPRAAEIFKGIRGKWGSWLEQRSAHYVTGDEGGHGAAEEEGAATPGARGNSAGSLLARAQAAAAGYANASMAQRRTLGRMP